MHIYVILKDLALDMNRRVGVISRIIMIRPETKRDNQAVKTKRKYIPKGKPDRLTWTPRETCPITGIGVAQTYRKLRNGEMPHIKAGNRFLIPKAALLDWLARAGSQPQEL
jgi:excisionase family DNA binding protein